jgi:hypothetical protein
VHEPVAAQADHLIHAGLEFAASLLSRYFRYARSAGERRAGEQLPLLRCCLSRAGIEVGTPAIPPPR